MSWAGVVKNGRHKAPSYAAAVAAPVAKIGEDPKISTHVQLARYFDWRDSSCTLNADD